MKVLFVFPDLSSTMTHYTGALSYGVGSLAAALREDGHALSLLHLVAPPEERDFRAAVREARPDLVAFSANSHYARRLRPWTTWAHEASGAPVVVGGVHATLAPEEVSALPDVRFTCIGEGEQPLRELCRALEDGADPAGIPNLWARAGAGVVRNATRPPVADLDTLPDPDLSIFDFDRLHLVRQGTFTFLMSRGCAYACTYCCAHGLHQAAGGGHRTWRYLSPERAAGQLEALLKRHMPGARDITFVDGMFFPDREWLARFAPLYRARVGLPFSCNLRADRVDPECAGLLRGMNCRRARLGVESGDERITREVLRRRLGLDDIRRAFELLRRNGIERCAYNMVGLPTETLPLALRTVRFNAEIEADLPLAFIFHPYPGTELRRRCAAEGWLTEREVDHYQAGSTIRMPQFAETDILFVHRLFRSLVRLYALGRRLPAGARRAWHGALDAVLGGPLLPRAAIVRVIGAYRGLRHRAGESIVRRSPWLYRLLGGRDPGLKRRHAVLGGPAA